MGGGRKAKCWQCARGNTVFAVIHMLRGATGTLLHGHKKIVEEGEGRGYEHRGL